MPQLHRIVFAGLLVGAVACTTAVDSSREAWSLPPEPGATAVAGGSVGGPFGDSPEPGADLLGDLSLPVSLPLPHLPWGDGPLDEESGDGLFGTGERAEAPADREQPWAAGPDSSEPTGRPQDEVADDGEAFSDDQWHFTAVPYMWLPTIKTWIDGASSTVHQGDLLDDLDFAYMGYLEARYQRWGVSLDSVYFRISDSFDPVPRVYGKVKVRQSLYQLQGFYRLGDENTFVDLTAGSRWIAISGALRLNGVTVGRRRLDWFEPVVGFKGSHRLNDKWAVGVKADVGGFGLGEAAAITYQGIADVAYQMSDTVGLLMGYRYVFIDQDPNFAFKQRVAGPMVGMTIRF